MPALSLILGAGITSAADPLFQDSEWIAPALSDREAPLPIFRKEFALGALPETAVVRIVGLGDYDLKINGRFVAPTGINQPWSQYEKTLYVREFDVRSMLKPGANCIGVMLYNSFWDNGRPPAGRYYKHGPQRREAEPFLLRAELVLTHKASRQRVVGTDASWRQTEGPVTFSHIFGGEDVDVARARALEGWSEPGCDASAWKPARRVDPPPGALVKQHWPGMKRFQRFQPTDIQALGEDTYLFSFPQNSSAQLSFVVDGGAPGSRIRIRSNEHRQPDKGLFGRYITSMELRTDGQPYAYQWRSFYLGTQFVEIGGAVPEGMPNPKQLPVIRNMELTHVRAGLPVAGSFESSSELFNRTHQLIDWAIRSNMSHVLTDCPHREKLGWLEVGYLMSPSILYNYGAREWFEKILRDVRDAQRKDGAVLTVAPSYPAGVFKRGFNYTVEWGAIAALLPIEHYRFHGDKGVLADSYDSMKAFTDHITANSPAGIAPKGLGDWYDYGHGKPPGPSRFTPVDLSSTATWAMCARAVADAAEILGKDTEAEHYRALHARIAGSFQRHFMDAESGSLKHRGSPQAANAMALCADLVPEESRAQLVDEIIADLKKRGWQQTPGDVGHVYFIRALAEAGRSDVLYKVYSRTGPGSYGGILAKGLTSMPETWDAMMDGNQSLNHCMLGHVMEWFHGYLVGIRPLLKYPGFEQFVIAPEVVGDLTYVKGHYDSLHGRIAAEWQRKGDQFSLQVTVPEGSEALVSIPARSPDAVTVSPEEATFLKTENGTAIYRVPAGTYSFQSTIRNDQAAPPSNEKKG